jgi:hypothetical protein
MNMLPSENEMWFCIMLNGELLDGANGLAIGETEQIAWERGIDPCEEWSIKQSKQQGCYVRRCALMVINA